LQPVEIVQPGGFRTCFHSHSQRYTWAFKFLIHHPQRCG
jgi:hypothetical protein